MANRRNEMTMAEYKSLNGKALWFNLVIMAIAVASIVSLLLTNFWKVKLKFEVSESMLKEAIKSSSDSSEEGSDIISKLDLSEFEGLVIEVSLSIEPDLLLTSITGGGKATAEKLVSSVVSDLSRQAEVILGNVLKPLTKTLVSTVLDEVKDQISTELGDEFINDLNLDGINDIIDKIVEGTTEDVLKEDIKSFIKNMLSESGLSDEDVNKFMEGTGEGEEDGLDSMIDEFVGGIAGTLGDSEGNISFNKAIINLAGEALGYDTQNMSVEDLAEELSAYLVEQMPPEAIDIIHYAMIFLAVLLLMPIAAWGLLLLFGFIRIFTKKKTLYMGLARSFGIIPYILLVIIPFFGFMIINLILGTEFLMTGLSFGVSSIGLMVSFIGACVLALLKWIRYGKIKKQIKRAVIIDDNFNESPEEDSFRNNNSFYERHKRSDENSNNFSNNYNSGDSNDFNSGNNENFW